MPDLAKEISSKIGHPLEIHEIDVTPVFASTRSGILKKALASPGGVVRCIIVKHFSGFLGKENEFQSRLGKELGSIARTYGLGGVFHSDELPNYGIAEDEVRALRTIEKLAPDDAFILIAGSKQKAERASIALMDRIQLRRSEYLRKRGQRHWMEKPHSCVLDPELQECTRKPTFL